MEEAVSTVSRHALAMAMEQPVHVGAMETVRVMVIVRNGVLLEGLRGLEDVIGRHLLRLQRRMIGRHPCLIRKSGRHPRQILLHGGLTDGGLGTPISRLIKVTTTLLIGRRLILLCLSLHRCLLGEMMGIMDSVTSHSNHLAAFKGITTHSTKSKVFARSSAATTSSVMRIIRMMMMLGSLETSPLRSLLGIRMVMTPPICPFGILTLGRMIPGQMIRTRRSAKELHALPAAVKRRETMRQRVRCAIGWDAIITSVRRKLVGMEIPTNPRNSPPQSLQIPPPSLTFPLGVLMATMMIKMRTPMIGPVTDSALRTNRIGAAPSTRASLLKSKPRSARTSSAAVS
mmetsp:Transcript_11183/g.22251  ORF Transcript_11183/g.22251 Transcript_11183/m.22251 type:complete len:343 (+) Transcript_11183:487-1515(+)